ncbi:MAG: hypothetical protein Q8P67_09245 [archaeon]|nr:hypothetical protein [archaeon]
MAVALIFAMAIESLKRQEISIQLNKMFEMLLFERLAEGQALKTNNLTSVNLNDDARPNKQQSNS